MALTGGVERGEAGSIAEMRSLLMEAASFINANNAEPIKMQIVS